MVPLLNKRSPRVPAAASASAVIHLFPLFEANVCTKIPPSLSQGSDPAPRLSPGVSAAPEDVESHFCGPEGPAPEVHLAAKGQIYPDECKDFFR